MTTKNTIEYHLITSHRNYRLVKTRAKKATVTFKEGDELQRYIGWLLLNRDCRICVHNINAEVTQIIESRRSGGK